VGSAVWCLACYNDVVIAGCRNGSIEVFIVPLCLVQIVILTEFRPSGAKFNEWIMDVVNV